MQVAGRPLAEWSWQEFEALPQTEIVTDIHCVTKWSKFDTRWRGVTFDDLLRAAGLDAAPTAFVMVHYDGGYSSNLPVADLIAGSSEERRVGKECVSPCSSRWSTYTSKKKKN